MVMDDEDNVPEVLSETEGQAESNIDDTIVAAVSNDNEEVQ
jgi:hypothetical protein